MSQNHITYFKVENFKKFDSLEVNDIGQFNLITGDNNSGKTCLLEALLFDERPKNTISWFQEMLAKRRLDSRLFMLFNELNDELNFETNTFAKYQKNTKESINFFINNKNFSIENAKEELNKSLDTEIQSFIKEWELFEYEGINKKSKNWIIFKIDNKIRYLLDLTSSYYEDFVNRPQNSKIPSIPAIMLNDEIETYLSINYDTIFINLNLGNRIAELVKNLFPKVHILEFQKRNNIAPVNFTSLWISTKERNQFHNIREYGEGFVRILFMITHLLSNNVKKLIIDEIDTGIHFSKLSNMWQTILLLCKELNVQLFATTHSKECIEAYVEVAEELGEVKEDIRLIELENYKNTEGIEKIISQTHNYEKLNFYIQNGSDRRG